MEDHQVFRGISSMLSTQQTGACQAATTRCNRSQLFCAYFSVKGPLFERTPTSASTGKAVHAKSVSVFIEKLFMLQFEYMSAMLRNGKNGIGPGFYSHSSVLDNCGIQLHLISKVRPCDRTLVTLSNLSGYLLKVPIQSPCGGRLKPIFSALWDEHSNQLATGLFYRTHQVQQGCSPSHRVRHVISGRVIKS